MADIATYTIGQEPKFGTDYIFNATSLGSTAAITSDVFKFGKVQSGVELVLISDEAITNTAAITIELLQDEEEDGAFATSTTIGTIAAGTIAAGDVISRFVSTKETLQYCKLKITTAEDLSAHEVTSYIRYIAR